MSRACYSVDYIELRLKASRAAKTTVSSLFRFELPLLTSFHLNVSATWDDTFHLQLEAIGKTWLKVGRRASRLRNFSFSGQLPNNGAFREIVRGAPQLEEVYLYFYPPRLMTETEPRLENVIQTFAECRNLCSLRISGLCIRGQGVAKKWCPSRFRKGHGAHLFIA